MNARWSVLALLVCAPSVQAGGFDPSCVAANATSVLHVDMAGVGRSTLLRALHASGQRVENEFDVDSLSKEFGIDFFSDLFSITSYSTGARGESTVTVVAGNEQLAAAWARRAKGQAPARRVAGREAIALMRGSDTPLVALLPARPGSPRMAVIAKDEAALQSALIVIDGEAPTLADAPRATGGAATSSSKRPKETPQAIVARPADSSLIFAATAPGAPSGARMTPFLERGLSLLCEFADLDSAGKDVVGLAARTLEFDLGEVGTDLVVRLAIETASPSDVRKLEDVLRGAMTKSAAVKDAPEAASRLKRVFDAIRFESRSARFTASFLYGASQLVADIDLIESSRGIRPGR